MPALMFPASPILLLAFFRNPWFPKTASQVNVALWKWYLDSMLPELLKDTVIELTLQHFWLVAVFVGPYPQDEIEAAVAVLIKQNIGGVDH